MRNSKQPPIEQPQSPQIDTDLEPYLEADSSLPGWPGFRTRPGHSGYDPVDTYAEYGHMQGLLLRYLFTGRLRTRNPIYLFFMLMLGIILTAPLIFGIVEIINFQFSNLLVVVFLGFSWIPGLALLVNIYLSIFHYRPELIDER